MLYRNLLRHQWKEFIRNPSWSGISVAYAIFLIVISSHDLNHITEVCRRIAVIERGVIVRDISTAPDTLRELERDFAVEET